MHLQRSSRRRPSATRTRRGVTTVETAVVLPVLLIVVFGFIEVTRCFTAYNAAQVAALDGARALALPTANAEKIQRNVLTTLTELGYDPSNITISISPEVILNTTNEVSINVGIAVPPLKESVNYTTHRRRELAR